MCSASRRATKSGDEPAGKPTMIRALRLMRLAWAEADMEARPARPAVALDKAMKRRRLGMDPLLLALISHEEHGTVPRQGCQPNWPALLLDCLASSGFLRSADK